MQLPENLTQRIDAFTIHVKELVNKYWQDHGWITIPPSYQAEFLSAKWCRINVVENGKVSSVYCFVCLQDGYTKSLGSLKMGDIHKAATFKAPAKHSRGSVFAEDFNKCANPFGIVYLR